MTGPFMLQVLGEMGSPGGSTALSSHVGYGLPDFLFLGWPKSQSCFNLTENYLTAL